VLQLPAQPFARQSAGDLARDPALRTVVEAGKLVPREGPALDGADHPFVEPALLLGLGIGLRAVLAGGMELEWVERLVEMGVLDELDAAGPIGVGEYGEFVSDDLEREQVLGLTGRGLRDLGLAQRFAEGVVEFVVGA